MGSGEYILWPFIASRTGLTLVWIATLGVLTQYFINTEIERYALATGETAVTGFTRLWKGCQWLFIVFATVPWVWPAWATGATTTLRFTFGFDEGLDNVITISLLVALGIILTASPVAYQTVEKMQMAFVAAICVFIVVAVFTAVNGESVARLGEGYVRVDRIPANFSGVGIAALFGALAFAGAGGSMNLTTSNWIRDKGFGMGARIPRITSPFTGEEEAAVTTGYFFRRNDENLRRWDAWWKVARQEQAVTFLLIAGVSIILFMLVIRATVADQTFDEANFDFILAVGEALKADVGGWLGTFYWVAGFIALFSTNIAVLDMVGRIVADILKVGPLSGNERWTENEVYFAVIWAEVAFSAVILFSGLNQPLTLAVIAAVLNGMVMFVYSVLLVQLNRFTLPAEIRMEDHRFGWMIWAVAFFGFFTVLTLVNELPKIFGGG